jgi:hypothetical protein
MGRAMYPFTANRAPTAKLREPRGPGRVCVSAASEK